MHTLSLHVENMLHAIKNNKEEEIEQGEEEEDQHSFNKVSDSLTKDDLLALRQLIYDADMIQQQGKL